MPGSTGQKRTLKKLNKVLYALSKTQKEELK